MENNKKYWLSVLFTFLGAISGYGYWYFIGCQTGSCPITSNWHTSIMGGGIVGYFLGDIFISSIKKHRQRKDV